MKTMIDCSEKELEITATIQFFKKLTVIIPNEIDHKNLSWKWLADQIQYQFNNNGEVILDFKIDEAKWED